MNVVLRLMFDVWLMFDALCLVCIRVWPTSNGSNLRHQHQTQTQHLTPNIKQSKIGGHLVFGVWRRCLKFGSWMFDGFFFVFGVWCLMFGVWCSVFGGAWCLVFGVWCSMFDVVWCLMFRVNVCVSCFVFDVWCLMFSVWCSMFGVRSSMFGVWSLAFVRCLVLDVWRSAFDVWNLIFGFCCFLVLEVWWLVFDVWCLVFGFRLGLVFDLMFGISVECWSGCLFYVWFSVWFDVGVWWLVISKV